MSYFDFDPLLQKGVEFAKTRRPLLEVRICSAQGQKVRKASNQVRSGDGVFYTHFVSSCNHVGS